VQLVPNRRIPRLRLPSLERIGEWGWSEMLKLKPHTTGLTLAATLVSLWAVCSLLYALAPAASVSAYATLFHGFQMSDPPAQITLSQYLLGAIYIIVAGYISGWLFAWLYGAFQGAAPREGP
jgi:hypothetical protein